MAQSYKRCFWLITLGSLLLLSTSMASAKNFEEGIHYLEVYPQRESDSGQTIEIIKFFIYGCPHCYNLDKALQPWFESKPKDIEFLYVPALFGGSANLHAEVYYALESMGESMRLHKPLFQAIHEEGRKLKTRQEIEQFLGSQGVDLNQFRQAIKSFAVKVKTGRARALLARYDIRSVPKLIIDGRYKSASALSHKDMVDMLDSLTKNIRQERHQK